jgi:hypothetical protein
MTIAEFFALPVGTRILWDRGGVLLGPLVGTVKRHDGLHILIDWDDEPNEMSICPDDTAIMEIIGNTTILTEQDGHQPIVVRS